MDIEKECEELSWLWFYAKRKRDETFNRIVEVYNYVVRGIKLRDEPLKNGFENLESEYCRAMLPKDFALVRVRFDSKTLVRSRKTLRMSLTDRISSFGEIYRELSYPGDSLPI